MLHFAYGANMSAAVMRRHAASAQAVGIAELANYRFIITGDGYASVEPACATRVYGVLWRLKSRDRVTLDAWESIAGRLYRAVSLPVQQAGRRRLALVYLARPRGEGRPKPGYIELVAAAAREWKIPSDYVASMELWLPARRLGASTRKLGEFGWT
jgi:hypothetical protein